MSELEKQELIDRLFTDHEVRLRLVEEAVLKMTAEQSDLRQTFSKLDKANAVTHTLIGGMMLVLVSMGLRLFGVFQTTLARAHPSG
ncbi:hypothetical protein [Thioalkalivibrio sp. HK1]|uniref:hypothetical protein n=1 Tax=Thioalkalivibrio sp. HK1 TaxID=1469245 RepID=UPI0004713D3B|nr:hypothetical protein [Thioalkalivibrio sp. HK1]